MSVEKKSKDEWNDSDISMNSADSSEHEGEGSAFEKHDISPREKENKSDSDESDDENPSIARRVQGLSDITVSWFDPKTYYKESVMYEDPQKTHFKAQPEKTEILNKLWKNAAESMASRRTMELLRTESESVSDCLMKNGECHVANKHPVQDFFHLATVDHKNAYDKRQQNSQKIISDEAIQYWTVIMNNDPKKIFGTKNMESAEKDYWEGQFYDWTTMLHRLSVDALKRELFRYNPIQRQVINRHQDQLNKMLAVEMKKVLLVQRDARYMEQEDNNARKQNDVLQQEHKTKNESLLHHISILKSEIKTLQQTEVLKLQQIERNNESIKNLHKQNRFLAQQNTALVAVTKVESDKSTTKLQLETQIQYANEGRMLRVRGEKDYYLRLLVNNGVDVPPYDHNKAVFANSQEDYFSPKNITDLGPGEGGTSFSNVTPTGNSHQKRNASEIVPDDFGGSNDHQQRAAKGTKGVRGKGAAKGTECVRGKGAAHGNAAGKGNKAVPVQRGGKGKGDASSNLHERVNSDFASNGRFRIPKLSEGSLSQNRKFDAPVASASSVQVTIGVPEGSGGSKK